MSTFLIFYFVLLTKIIVDLIIHSFNHLTLTSSPIFIAEEVERLLKDYKQNQDFIRNLGSRFYQIIYPIQVRQRERFGVSTREIEGSYGKVSDVIPIFWRRSPKVCTLFLSMLWISVANCEKV